MQVDRIELGDSVIYTSYGVGRVTETRCDPAGRTEVVVLEFAGGLAVTLPIERALQYLRAPSSETELAGVQRTLRAAASAGDDSWRLRLKATQDKVSAGEALGLAEVVRDGAHCEPKLTARGGLRELSLAERQLYLKARQLLTDEIADVRGIETADADGWITAQLEHAASATTA
jgi:RNA polymerase-interacting CarD/CdnL/TRCF family regulator